MSNDLYQRQLEKAQKLSIKIINEEEFLDLIKTTNN